MSEIIDFPNKGQTYYRKAMKELQAGKVDDALQLFEKSLDEEVNIEVVLEFVNACIFFNKIENLSTIWQKYFSEEKEIFKIEELAQIYIASLDYILPIPKRLLTFTRLKEQIVNNHFDETGVNQLISYYQELNLIKMRLEDYLERSAINEWMSNFMEQDPFSQLKNLKQYYLLEFELVLPFIKSALMMPTILNFIKSDILHFLIYQNAQETVELSWFGKPPVKLNSAELSPYSEISLVKETKRRIETYCDKYDPHLEDALLEQLMLQAMVLYPFFDETGITSEVWFKQLIWEGHVNFNEMSIPEQYLMRAQNETVFLMLGEDEGY